MALMHVLVKKSLNGLMGQNPVLECLSVRVVWVHVATSYHARP
jgi:hypothetical protein